MPDPVQLLSAWLALETLTPRVVRYWQEFAEERRGREVPGGAAPWLRPRNDAPAPLTDPRKPQPRDWYIVVLGSVDARTAFGKLDGRIGGDVEGDELARSDGNVLAATMLIDESGIPVPDSVVVSSFVWALGEVLHTEGVPQLDAWEDAEKVITADLARDLSGRATEGLCPNCADLEAISDGLRERLRVPGNLWTKVPSIIISRRIEPPEAEILSSFLLPDLQRARAQAKTGDIRPALAAYLGLRPPRGRWNPFSDRLRLATTLEPQRFPLGRWPAAGLHPLNFLQQSAVNNIVGDLTRSGLAAVNGPPGTGKTTLLRDIVAHVLVLRAEQLVACASPDRAIEAYLKGEGALDLLDFAMVVASTNNTAVENVSEALPLRAAIDESLWDRLSLYPLAADCALEVAADAEPQNHAWGLIAARLGNKENRTSFANRAWYDRNHGLLHWFDASAYPDYQSNDPNAIREAEPPLSRREAFARWRQACSEFSRARHRARELRAKLQKAYIALHARQRLNERLVNLAAAEANATAACRVAREKLKRVTAITGDLKEQAIARRNQLEAVRSIRPPWFARLFKTGSWQAWKTRLEAALDALLAADSAGAAAEAERQATTKVMQDKEADRDKAAAARAKVQGELALTDRALVEAEAIFGEPLPNPLSWQGPGEELYRSSPWNAGQFRTARDELFVATVAVHRAFLEAASRSLKKPLNAFFGLLRGGQLAPEITWAPSRLWGLSFLLTPVVSTTFASMGRLFTSLNAESLGWLMIDEAGQATPQAAVGAIWRARRAVVIGDPMQIEPVTTSPVSTERKLCASHEVSHAEWAAPIQSAQTLADRASTIAAIFPDGDEGRRVGMPLLVHRRCETPMFDIANTIAYAGKMVQATISKPPHIRNVLGASAWIDIEAPSADKWVAAEGEAILAALENLYAEGIRNPDICMISPFRIPAARLRALIRQRPHLIPESEPKKREDWLKDRIGTVHTFQGKEAEGVILMLGAGRGAKAGSRNWAAKAPNLLNVAVTRAMQSFYIVGNHELWSPLPYFSIAADLLGRPVMPVDRPGFYSTQKFLSLSPEIFPAR